MLSDEPPISWLDRGTRYALVVQSASRLGVDDVNGHC